MGGSSPFGYLWGWREAKYAEGAFEGSVRETSTAEGAWAQKAPELWLSEGCSKIEIEIFGKWSAPNPMLVAGCLPRGQGGIGVPATGSELRGLGFLSGNLNGAFP